jgi:hypothetical protein
LHETPHAVSHPFREELFRVEEKVMYGLDETAAAEKWFEVDSSGRTTLTNL